MDKYSKDLNTGVIYRESDHVSREKLFKLRHDVPSPRAMI